MTFVVARAETEEEKEAVYRFRYSVCVEEMGRYQQSADHVGRRLVEPEDERGWIFFARDGDDVVGTARLSWGADAFSPRQIDEYSLTPFLDEVPHGMLAVGERVMVMPKCAAPGSSTSCWSAGARWRPTTTSVSCSARASRICCRCT